MRIIKRNPETNNYDIDITIEEWKSILRLPAVHKNPNLLSALENWYHAPACTASCKTLAQQYGKTHQYYSVQNRKLGEIAVAFLGRFTLIRSDGKETYWPIAWIEIAEHHKEYTVQLRPELVKAITEIGLFK